MVGKSFRNVIPIGLILVSCALPAAAEDSAGTAEPDSARAEDPTHHLETLVVTATRKEEAVEKVPASVTVFGSQKIETSPADNFFADGLRSVPGINISQTSAADISISTRTATNVIPQGQLAMVDYRTVYQDFNGFVLWGTIPLEMEDVDRIEIIRGPGSAVWGVNAMHGIVHVVTKAPRDMVGTRLRLKGGELSTAGANLSHAGVTRKLGYRVSGGYDFQGPFTQPTGAIPGSAGPTNPGGTLYPEYENLDTKRYRANGRLDYQIDEESTLSVSGGYAALEGIFMSPAGPTTIEKGTMQAFGKIDFTRRSMRVTAFINNDSFDGMFLNGDILSTSNDQTYNIDFSDTRLAGGSHYLTYGVNLRHNAYDNDLVPDAEDRDSYGAFIQDDFFLTEMTRLVVGARLDNVDPMGTAISPRASLLVSPWTDQVFRLSYNRAYQAPSILQNYSVIPNILPITFPDFNNPGSGDEVTVPILAMSYGNTDLDPKELDAYEIGWAGRIGERTSLNVTGYWNEFKNAYQYLVTETYTGTNPPFNWPFDPALLDGPLANSIPSEFQVQNLGKSTERGVEIGGEVLVGRSWTVWGNYSWQDVPQLEDYDPVPMPDGSERMPVNIPPRNRFNLGMVWDKPRFFANGAVSYQGDAFWADVLDSRAWGPTESFTTVNAAVGVRLNGGRMVVSLSALNLFDARVQQHVWGDFIDRRIIGQVTVRF